MSSAVRLLAGLGLVSTLLLWPSAGIAAEPGCPGTASAQPEFVFCEDFEDGFLPALWDVGSSQGQWPPAEFVMCADGFGFNSSCAAWTNLPVFDGEFGFYGYDGRRQFQPQSEFYVRWYQYVSDPYTWGTLEDKALLVHDVDETITAYIATSRDEGPGAPASGPGKPFLANYQDLDWPDTDGQFTLVNRFQNQGQDITLQPGRWYLFEWYIKLNSPGASDGVAKLWIDDATQPITSQTLRMHYTDMRWLRAEDAGKQFGVLRLTVYHQRCDILPDSCPPLSPLILTQSQRWDQIVISQRPVGPFAPAAPVCDCAQAVPDVLWPPNHRLVSVGVTGIVHPRQRALTIAITGVTDDDAGARPRAREAELDVVIEGHRVLLRAERAGNGRGRTYRVRFVAHDPAGASCTGMVAVVVPHDAAAIGVDGGPAGRRR